MDVNDHAVRHGLEYAVDKGLAVVVMEPLRGGRLGKEPPESVAKLWAGAHKKRTPAEWGLLWVWNQPEISVALSGMSAMEHVVENVAIADRSRPGILTADELELIDQVREAYLNLGPVPCTNCGYCMPCPNGVEIPSIFRLYNEAVIYDALLMARFRYRGSVGLKEEQRADRCIECMDCVEVCPQAIPIPEWLQKIHALLSSEE